MWFFLVIFFGNTFFWFQCVSKIKKSVTCQIVFTPKQAYSSAINNLIFLNFHLMQTFDNPSIHVVLFCCCWSIHFCALPYLIYFLWLAIILAFYLVIEYFTQSLRFSFVLLHSCMLFMSCLILFLSSFWVHYFFQFLYLCCHLLLELQMMKYMC